MVGRYLQLRSSFGPLNKVFRGVRRALPPLNFITIHYIYFICTCLVCAVIFWGASTPTKSVSFTDSLFLVVSAMTLAGLNTVNLSTLNTFQQVMLFMLIVVGSAIFVSAFVVHVRKRAFEKKFDIVVEHKRLRRLRSRSRSRSRNRSRGRNVERISSNDIRNLDEITVTKPTETSDSSNVNDEKQSYPEIPSIVASEPLAVAESPSMSIAPSKQLSDDHVSFSPTTIFRNTSQEKGPISVQGSRHSRILSMQGVGAISTASFHGSARRSESYSRPTSSAVPASENMRTSRYFPSYGLVSRNSSFHNLTAADREKLGGVEYKAIRLLAVLVPLYFVLWQLLGCIALGAYVAHNRPDIARRNGFNPWWVGAFNGVSAFNNSGMSLLDANMTAFQTSYYMLMTMGLMILAGNTCYPVFLRLIVWSLWRLTPKSEKWEGYRSTLRFLLDHPRRCYTNLFPKKHTWWLAMSVITLNGIDWAAFEILNIGNSAITDLPTGTEVIDGLFQALAVRSGGFYVVPIPTVRISLQCLYVIMMYISVYPVVITMRNSNVYEERSLGIYADDPGYNTYESQNRSFFSFFKKTLTTRETKSYFVRQQLRAQLAHDLWWIVLAVFFIMIIEGHQFERDPATFSVFNVIFEVVSGYGCVGISIGLPDEAYSFSGSWHVLSKLILCAVMLRGRHRGLPVAIDKAVMLPGEDQDAEEEDAAIRIERAVSRTGAA